MIEWKYTFTNGKDFLNKDIPDYGELFKLDSAFRTMAFFPDASSWYIRLQFAGRATLLNSSKTQIVHIAGKFISNTEEGEAICRIEAARFVSSDDGVSHIKSYKETNRKLGHGGLELQMQFLAAEKRVYIRATMFDHFLFEDYVDLSEQLVEDFEVIGFSKTERWVIDCRIRKETYGIEQHTREGSRIFAVGKVIFRHGDMLDMGHSLKRRITVLPASDNGTTSLQVMRSAAYLKIPFPEPDKAGTVKLHKRIIEGETAFVGYGCSVEGNTSGLPLVRQLCEEIITKGKEVSLENDIDAVNIPVFGTGAGALDVIDVVEVYDHLFNAYHNPFPVIVNIQGRAALDAIKVHFRKRLIYLEFEPRGFAKPESIKELEKSQGISLHSQDFSIDRQGRVVQLELSLYKFSNIEFISRFPYLHTLTFCGLETDDLSPVSGLANLERLILEDCNIVDISFLSGLKKLRVISMYNNKIRDISPLTAMSNLVHLNLSHNTLVKIDGLQKLKDLIILEVDHNNLEAITPLTDLKKLYYLDISHNAIKSITPLMNKLMLCQLFMDHNNVYDFTALHSMPELEVLRADNNPLFADSELLLTPGENQRRTILNFLKRQEEGGDVETVLPAKVLLLGNHASGKSSLLHYFMEDELKSDSSSTHIIQIEQYPRKRVGIPEAVFFDFGGQDYYHGIYRVFLSAGSIYLILWNPSENSNRQIKDPRDYYTQNFTLPYWLAQKKYLESEKYNGTSDPVLIIQTYADKYPRQAHGLKTDDILNDFFVDLQKKDGSADPVNEQALRYLKATLARLVESRRHKRKEPRWYADFIKYILKENAKNSFKSKNVKDILPYYKRQVENEDKIALLKDDLDQLHKQGLVLYYKNEIPDNVWLSPIALVKHIHEDILQPATDGRRNACVNYEEFNEQYGEDIVQLLCNQKVIFRHKFGEAGEEYIIPNYLPLASERPADFALFTFGLDNPLFTLKFRDFIPFGFINQLICFFGALPDNKKFWRDQLLFTIDKRVKVLIRIDFDHLEIKVEVSFAKGVAVPERDNYIRYLFYCIMGLYWDMELFAFADYVDHSAIPRALDAFSTEDPMRRKIQCYNSIYEKKDCRPDDLYISVNGKDFIQYTSLFDMKDVLMVPAYAMNEGHEMSANPGTIPVYPFRHFTPMALKRRLKMVISYSKDDLAYVDRFLKYMMPLYDDGLIENPWYCTLLVAGREWNEEITAKFAEADIICFMISDNLMATKYVKEVEIVNAIDRLERKEPVKIVPIMLEPYDFARKGKYNLARFTALPFKLKPVSTFDNQRVAWYLIAYAIKRTIELDLDLETDSEALNKDIMEYYKKIAANELI